MWTPDASIIVTAEQRQADAMALAVETYRKAIQALIDSKASERQYDSGATFASYVNSTKPEWAAEAKAFVAWRDQVWSYALAELDKVQSGEREQPSVEAFLSELPVFDWPSS
ncbi:hypothetical protein AAIB41_13950 [Brucella sp. BE17]|uniref:hypothetical protein n=1 Tax=Brucella sp. BE17 TaxID=3142977 RepID=UPI0031BA2A4E